ncbi:hypothetical protein PGB90_007437 [Kerria lacca]
METWLKLSIWVAVYGFLKDCQPLDSYIVQYLLSPPLNFTTIQIMQEILPIATYVSLVELILVFLLTDWLRYRPVIFVNAISYIGMMIMELCYGTVMSTEVAYYTYIYTKVGKEHYQAVTSYMRTSSLLGRCVGCFLGQVLCMNGMLSKLCYIQFFGAVTTFFWAFILPPVKTSVYFYRYDNTILDKAERKPVVVSNSDIIHNVENGYSPAMKKICKVPCNVVMKRMWNEFKYVYTNPYTLKWSIWYALCLCGYSQEGTYSQSLWQHVQEGQDYNLLTYNGFTESAHTIFGAVAAFASSYVVITGEMASGFLMSISAILGGLLILCESQASNLWLAFSCHVLFSGIYFFAVSVGYAEIAKNIPSDCFALVFGINTFISLIIQSFLTITFHGKGGLELSPRQQVCA